MFRFGDLADQAHQIPLSVAGAFPADQLGRRVGWPRVLFGLFAAVFIMAQLALISRLPLASFIPWAVIAAVGAGTVLSPTILSEYFPKELAGMANAALNVCHIGGAFVVQCMTGLVIKFWTPIEGYYPDVAYRAAFASNVGLQIPAAMWFALVWTRSPKVAGYPDGRSVIRS